MTKQWRTLILVAMVILVACGTSTAPTGTPLPVTAVPPVGKPEPTATDTQAQPSATASPRTTPQPERPQTAKDRAVAVISVEPEHLSIRNIDAHGGQLQDTISGYMAHVDRDTRQVSPSSLIQAWRQTSPDQWEYDLRSGVTFHDGASWDVAAWQEYAKVAGVSDFPLTSFAITGPYTVEEIDPLHARIRCGGPCPLFEWGMYLSKTYSPRALRAADFIDLRDPAGAGPYRVVDWVPGQKIVTEAFEDFVPAPESPEFAPPILSEIEWTWREETSVRAAMIEVGEADWSFLLSQDDANRLGPDRYVVGGTAEMAWYRIDTIWDPWLSQKEMRQALVHSIDCQAIVESLYQGTTTCRGNFGAPGVNGINDENIKPYEYDPTLSRQLLEGIGYLCGRPGSAPDCEAEININSRSGRIPMHQEMVEAIVSYMREAGINAKARFLEGSIRAAMRDCGVGIPGAQRVGWQGATENKRPPTCDPGQILDIVGTAYEDLDYGKFMGQRLSCLSAGGTVCFPEREAEWNRIQGLSGDARRQALEGVAATVREEVLGLPLFDLSAIYGVNPKLRGFEQPRFDKHLFANLWWFEE
ncbi:MAG TPA: ABC transporter substrate-binding protein [Dehalococcoidia bacterium]|nr:ABC transporter substrate-binding protein [Dehalococcoidia bacterium]